jgi:hypothetical protein
MKLNKITLFLIIVISLFLGMLTHSVVEGMTSKDSKDAKDAKDHKDSKSHSTTKSNGIPKSQIPDGDEDLYILKSQIVPPVCPACPQNTSCPREKPPPPCPPCARCPEPSFECKKVPNYKSTNQQYLPKPMLTDFSQF